MSEEYRRAKRKQVAERIDVVDTMIDTPVGVIGNISETGMMLLANQALGDDALYQMRFSLTEANGGRRDVSLGAHQLWSEPASMPGQHWVGFRFIDIAADDEKMLAEWLMHAEDFQG